MLRGLSIENTNVIVTGGAGYIGSHACKALRENGYNPIAVDSLITGWRDAVKYGVHEHVDLLERDKLDAVFKKFRPVGVLHFAALSQVGESVLMPKKYWVNNVLGSINLIEVALENECNKLVFSSTAATYAEDQGGLLTEISTQTPKSPYGWSKLATEQLLKQYAEISPLQYVVFRYFNVAGADPDGEIGEFHNPETHLIPLALAAAKTGSDFTIFGNEHSTRDGTCIRDYVHVSDLVDAHLRGLSLLEHERSSASFNLGTGQGYSVLEVLEEVECVTRKKINKVVGSARKGDPASLVADASLAKTELGWKPTRSNLEQMISDAWRWYKLDGYKK